MKKFNKEIARKIMEEQDENFIFIAQEKSGLVCVYESEPELTPSGWDLSYLDYSWESIDEYHEYPGGWKKSLFHRSELEESDGGLLKEYKIFNHHREITSDQDFVDFGTGRFVADKKMIPLLKAMNEAGIITRSHCCGHGENAWVSFIMPDDMSVEIRTCTERDSGRKNFEGKREIMLSWRYKSL